MKKMIATSLIVLTSSFFIFSFNDFININKMEKNYIQVKNKLDIQPLNYSNFKKELSAYDYTSSDFQRDKQELSNVLTFDGKEHSISNQFGLSSFFEQIANNKKNNNMNYILKYYDIDRQNASGNSIIKESTSTNSFFEKKDLAITVLVYNGNQWSDWANNIFKEQNMDLSFEKKKGMGVNFNEFSIFYSNENDFKKALENDPHHDKFLDFIYKFKTGQISDKEAYNALKTISFLNEKINQDSYVQSLNPKNDYSFKEYNKILFLNYDK